MLESADDLRCSVAVRMKFWVLFFLDNKNIFRGYLMKRNHRRTSSHGQANKLTNVQQLLKSDCMIRLPSRQGCRKLQNSKKSLLSMKNSQQIFNSFIQSAASLLALFSYKKAWVQLSRREKMFKLTTLLLLEVQFEETLKEASGTRL